MTDIPRRSSSRRNSKLLPNRGPAGLAVGGLAVATAADSLHILLYGYVLANWGQLEDTTLIEQLEQGLVFLQLAAVVFAGFAFLRWFHRAYRNASALGHSAQFTPGWAIGAWFVPFLNLVRPYQIASAMWRHAGAHVGRGSVVGIWWGMWLASGFISKVGEGITNSENSDVVFQGFLVLIGSCVATLVAGVMAIKIVRQLTRAHEAMVPELAAEVFA